MRSASKTERLVQKLKNKEYRDAFASEHVWTGVPFQVKTLRDDRQWSQESLAKEAEMGQSQICRLEDINYGSFTMKSLLRLASAFDVALVVKFVPFSRLLKETEDLSPEALSAESFSKDKFEPEHKQPVLAKANVLEFLTGAQAEASRQDVAMGASDVKSSPEMPDILSSNTNASQGLQNHAI